MAGSGLGPTEAVRGPLASVYSALHGGRRQSPPPPRRSRRCRMTTDSGHRPVVGVVVCDRQAFLNELAAPHRDDRHRSERSDLA